MQDSVAVLTHATVISMVLQLMLCNVSAAIIKSAPRAQFNSIIIKAMIMISNIFTSSHDHNDKH
jgi:hypothetical protein